MLTAAGPDGIPRGRTENVIMERSEAVLEPDLPIVDPHHHLWHRPATLVAALPQTGHGFEDIIRAVPRYLLDELLGTCRAATT